MVSMRSQAFKVALKQGWALFCLVLCVGLQSADTFADKRVDIYSDTQLVLDQSESLRQQATNSSLATVIIKASGHSDVLQHPQVKAALAKANTYLAKYSYSSTDQTITIAGAQRPARQLLLQFSAPAIQRLLKTAQLPVWPEVRPEVLIWVASDRQGKRLLSSDSKEVNTLKEAASRRGIPVSTPLLDLADRQALSASRLWAMDESAIRNASARYGLQGVLAGRFVAVSGSSWQGRFILLHKSQRLYFTATNTTPALVAQDIINQTANYFSGLDAIVVNDAQTAPSVTITVANIHRFDQYASLMNYLNELPVIAGVIVNLVDDGTLTLELSYNGSADKLMSVLSNSQFLQEVPSIANSVTPVAASYTWR